MKANTISSLDGLPSFVSVHNLSFTQGYLIVLIILIWGNGALCSNNSVLSCVSAWQPVVTWRAWKSGGLLERT